PQIIILTSLLIFSGLASPIVRSALQIILFYISGFYSLGLHHFRRVSFATIIFVILFPNEIFSTSFHLSAIASYSIAYLKKHPMILSLGIFIFMYPLLIKFQGQH